MSRYDYKIKMPRGTIHTSSVEAASESEAVQFVKAIHPDSEITELSTVGNPYQLNTARPDEAVCRKMRSYDYTVRTLRGSIEKSRIEAESEAEAYRSVQAIYPGGHIMEISTTYKPKQPLPDRSPVAIMMWLHVPLALLGLYNIFKAVDYYIVVWQSLHAQGIGHVYLVIVTFMGWWWLGLALMFCFSGNLLIYEGGSGLKVFLKAILGAGLSLVFPPLMEAGFVFVVVWARSLL